ncbi:hypothetical protein DL93DRAFT_1703625 [Clavulina sp. PMI_390]|nr:hypothetical protein DL93DRAFT_1703625 [Clavulina sp. PMI_390]
MVECSGSPRNTWKGHTETPWRYFSPRRGRVEQICFRGNLYNTKSQCPPCPCHPPLRCCPSFAISCWPNFSSLSSSRYSITKVSYDELYDQAYASPGSGTDLPIESLDDSHVFARLHQFEIFGLIVGADDSEKSMKAVAKYRLITFSLDIKKAARGYWRFVRKKNPMRHEDSFDWHDTMVLAWQRVMVSCHHHQIDGPAEEAVFGNLIFLLEEWSVDALEYLLKQITIIVSYLTARLVDSKNKNEWLALRFWRQVYIVHIRLADRPRLKPAVAQEWKRAYDEMSRRLLPPSNLPEPRICAQVGCIEMKPADMVCSACKNQLYCSTACQKNDWKNHKTRCKG